MEVDGEISRVLRIFIFFMRGRQMNKAKLLATIRAYRNLMGRRLSYQDDPLPLFTSKNSTSITFAVLDSSQ